MPSKKTSSYIMPALFLVTIVACFLLGFSLVLRNIYGSQEEAYKEEVSKLPAFDEEAESKETAQNLGFEWPCQAPKMKPEAILKKYKENVKGAVTENYNARELSKQTLEILKKYSVAQKGDRIKFQLKGSNELVEGAFVEIEKRPSGGDLVLLDNGVETVRYPMTKIMEEYYYLFREHDSKYIQEKKIAELKESFGSGKANFEEKIGDQLQERYFKEAGYVKGSNGEWQAKSDLVIEQVHAKRKKFEAKRAVELERMKNRHLMLWIFGCETPKSPES